MTWGQALRSDPAFNWLGGAICLAVLSCLRFRPSGACSARADRPLPITLAIGIIRAGPPRCSPSPRGGAPASIPTRDFEIFVYQLVGVLAAVGRFLGLGGGRSANFLPHGQQDGPSFVVWWGTKPGFAGRFSWSRSHCSPGGRLWAAIRRHAAGAARCVTGPLVWLAFLLFRRPLCGRIRWPGSRAISAIFRLGFRGAQARTRRHPPSAAPDLRDGAA